MTQPLELVEQRLAAHGCRPQRRGEHLTARCPAHEDSNPSLSVSPGTSRDVVINCFAGCEPDDVMGALGLKWSDLSTNGNSANGRQIIAQYPYTDEAGDLLYEVVRYAPKDFRQRRPDPAAPGGWSWKISGVRRVLYRLPAVIAAAKAGKAVWIVEGEKDADRLAAEGVCATTCSGGAGRFTLNMAEHLAGAEVIVVADNDKPGKAHAAEVAFFAGSAGAASVRIVTAAEGKDASDHLAAGHGLDEFTAVALDAEGPATEQAEEHTLSRFLVD